MVQFDRAVPIGSKILVTGVNGLVGSHVADQLLQHGYLVRGSVRDVSKSSFLNDKFASKYGENKVELVQVENMIVDGAFDGAVRGVAGIVHVATIFDQGPGELVASVIRANVNILNSAAKESTVKGFGSMPVRNDSWNKIAIQESRKQLPDSLQIGFPLYCASKALGEEAIWEWMEEHQPHLKISTVLQSVCFGASIDPVNQGHASSSAWPAALYQNKLETLQPIFNSVIPTGKQQLKDDRSSTDRARAYCVDAQDVGRLHLAALVYPDVQSERIFAFGHPFVWGDIFAAFQKIFPDREFSFDRKGQACSIQHVQIEPMGRAETLLKQMGRSGFTGLEEMWKSNVADLV